MNTDHIIKRDRLEMIINIAVGIVLLAAGIFMRVQNIHIIQNNKALIGLSFIPLAIAFTKWFNLYNIRKHPKQMSTVIISENDERLVNERNEAEANTSRVFRWMLYLIFMGYSLIVPSDVFEAAGWWIVFSLFCMSYLLPLIFLKRISKKSDIEDN
jgi:hypothetical protein